MHFNKNALFC